MKKRRVPYHAAWRRKISETTERLSLTFFRLAELLRASPRRLKVGAEMATTVHGAGPILDAFAARDPQGAKEAAHLAQTSGKRRTRAGCDALCLPPHPPPALPTELRRTVKTQQPLRRRRLLRLLGLQIAQRTLRGGLSGPCTVRAFLAPCLHCLPKLGRLFTHPSIARGPLRPFPTAGAPLGSLMCEGRLAGQVLSAPHTHTHARTRPTLAKNPGLGVLSWRCHGDCCCFLGPGIVCFREPWLFSFGRRARTRRVPTGGWVRAPGGRVRRLDALLAKQRHGRCCWAWRTELACPLEAAEETLCCLACGHCFCIPESVSSSFLPTSDDGSGRAGTPLGSSKTQQLHLQLQQRAAAAVAAASSAGGWPGGGDVKGGGLPQSATGGGVGGGGGASPDLSPLLVMNSLAQQQVQQLLQQQLLSPAQLQQILATQQQTFLFQQQASLARSSPSPPFVYSAAPGLRVGRVY
ncbi:hypothetical protein HPB48_006780 [Haemaphysalis longicornis]|uniref:Uncharacterized protein n=1 Tax=Haemaphysalis longicornis TaxID=44386 RepID=A0A9J6FML4_HAELO|nr:hypothetical protein HPB48_006780 [Haemaphysalis longicornis]